MTDKFLGVGNIGNNIANGTLSIYGSKIGAKNLDPGRAIKTDSQGRLQTTDLAINDITNLQSVLDNIAISNPYTPEGGVFVINGSLECNDLETTSYFSVNNELQKIDNFVASSENITNVSGLINTYEISSSKLYNIPKSTFIELDDSDINISATNLTFNGDDILTTDSIIDLEQKTINLPDSHNPFIFTNTEPINNNQNRVYLDDELNLYSGSFGDGSFPIQSSPVLYSGTVRSVTTETELDSAILSCVDYDQILVTSSFFLTSSKTINKKIQIRASSNIHTLTFASATQLFLITSSYVSFANLSFNNLNTGSSNANILNFSLSTGINNFVTGCNFETNEFAIVTNNTNIQIINNTFRFVGTPDSHRYIYLTGCLGSTFINNNIFEGNGVSSTQCILINASPTSFLNGNLIIKNNISQVEPVQRLLMVEVNMTNSNFSLYVSSNTITTTSGFIILYSLPLDGIKQIYLYNNTEILASGITGGKGIIGIDSVGASVISFNTKIYSSRNTIPVLRADYTDLINPLAEQPKVIAYLTSKFTPAQTYDVIIPFIGSLGGGTTDLTALETKTQNLTSNGIDETNINGFLTIGSLSTETISDTLLSSSIGLSVGGINITSDALNFNGSSVVYTPFISAIHASAFIVTGGTNNQYLLADGSTLTQSANSGNSNFYLYDSSTSGIATPTAGLITYNNAVQANATFIYISHLTRDGIDIEVFIKQISLSTDVYIQDQSTSENYIQYNVTGTPVIVVDSRITIPVALRQGAGTGLTNFSNNHNVLLAFFTNSLEVDTRISTLETKTQNIIDANVNQTSFGGSLGIIASAFVKSGGSANQFLKANGTIDSSTYLSASNAIITTLQTQNQNQIGTSTNTSFSGSGGVSAVKFVKDDGLTTQFLKANGDSDSTSYVPAISGLIYGGKKFCSITTGFYNSIQTDVNVIPSVSPAGGTISSANEAVTGSTYHLYVFGVMKNTSITSLKIEFLNSTFSFNTGIPTDATTYNYKLDLTIVVTSTTTMTYTGELLIYSPTPVFTRIRNNVSGANTTISTTFALKYTSTVSGTGAEFQTSSIVFRKTG